MKYRQGVEIKLPDSNKVRNAFSNVEKNFDSLISFVSTEKSPTFSEYHGRLQSVVMELTQIFGELQLLTATNNPKYKRALEGVQKTLIRLVVDVNALEAKHVGRDLLSWEHKFREEKMRKDLIKFFKTISRQMKRIQKNI
jgi:hypothetical protein